ncbi:MAG: hypothetical protein PHV37_07900 [Candidatus Gastranaerophilales bacterium]|nr:hypothetical protein [Candidatus Gastranaerophilales bacterium]
MVYDSNFEQVQNDDSSQKSDLQNVQTKNLTLSKSLPQKTDNYISEVKRNKALPQITKQDSKQHLQRTSTIKDNTVQQIKKPASSIKMQPAKSKKTLESLAKQEEIAWNVWRSNIQNQIMNDASIGGVPNGTVFKFSFVVDRYGKVSNVKTWSLNPTYTPLAIQYIAPVIRGYQGHSILDFPRSSNRITTTVDGGFKVSQVAKYSKPSDYNDIEKK